MQKVYAHDMLTMVQIARDLLESNDIRCFLKNEFYASGGHVGFETIPIELWIYNSDDAHRTEALLEQQFNVNTESTTWLCSKCSEQNDGSFETCWKCQSERPSP